MSGVEPTSDFVCHPPHPCRLACRPRMRRKRRTAEVTACVVRMTLNATITWGSLRVTPRERRVRLDRLHRSIRVCTKCRLCESRTHAVPGEGPYQARVMFVGEAPGAHEDAAGRPFVGRAGQFLDEMLAILGLPRRHVFVTNTVKCRPPRNRPPRADELATCRENWLDRQIDLVRPKIVVLLGATAVRQIFGGRARLSALHGKARVRDDRTYFITYHPASAMRFPNARKAAGRDLVALEQLVAQGDDSPRAS
jgi:uracil-DNA glycosylase family 4